MSHIDGSSQQTSISRWRSDNVLIGTRVQNGISSGVNPTIVGVNDIVTSFLEFGEVGMGNLQVYDGNTGSYARGLPVLLRNLTPVEI